MFEIYRRFDTPSNMPPQRQQYQPQGRQMQNSALHSQQPQGRQGQNPTPQSKQAQNRQTQNHTASDNVQSNPGHNYSNRQRSRKAPKSGLGGILNRILPASVYNPETKKIFGFLSAEDLLLVALIFLFMDNDDEDNTLMVLALIFVLVSDYIDLSDFSF